MTEPTTTKSRTSIRARPRRPGHHEEHSGGGATIRDVIIGMSDGLTVPFALAAGITGAIAASHIVVTAGMAELAAGGISMGLGGYLAARSDAEHYDSEQRREEEETHSVPDEERHEIEAIFKHYGISGESLDQVVAHVTANRKRWVEFMMRFELGLERPDPRQAPISALRIGGSYVVGGLVPLVPYFVIADSRAALPISAAVTFVALVTFGAVKGRFTGASVFTSAWQTALIGGIAAAAAFGLARLVS